MKHYIVNCRFATQRQTGVQKFAIQMARVLKKTLGESVEFVSPSGEINISLKEEFQIKAIGVLNGHFWEQISLPLYCRKKKSILFTFSGAPSIIYSSLIYTIHDLAIIRQSFNFNFFYVLYYKFIIAISIKNFLAIITVSNFSKSEIQKYYNYKKEIYVIPNAINLKKDYYLNTDFLKIDTINKYILMVGTLEPRKNLVNFINKFINIKTDYKLIIVGSENKLFKKHIFADKINLDRVIFTGYLDEEKLNTLYERASCFVSASSYEGFSITPMEAMQFGTPILISDIPVHNEIYSRFAVFFNVNDKIPLNKLIEIAKLKRDNWQSADIKEFYLKYSENVQIENIKKVLLNVN